MKTDFDFGTPMAFLVISIRELAALRIKAAVSINQNDPNEIEKELMEVIRYFRPHQYEKGCIVAIDTRQFMWSILFLHPDLPRMPQGSFAPEIYLNPCDVCGKDIPHDRTIFPHIETVLVGEDDPTALRSVRNILCCSPECVEKAKNHKWEDNQVSSPFVILKGDTQ